MKYIIPLLSILFTLVSFSSNKSFELAPDIYILDKEAPIKSLEELTDKLKGKPLYIDRWATWCNPCIEQFKYSTDLHNFLKDNKIEIVYLNSDKDLDEQKWFEFIIDHNLKGYHIRLNNALGIDLTRKGIYIPGLPQYIIIGKDGNLIENKALKPSTGEKLHNQLKEKLNL
ncbi:MAG: hypothetical protein C0599_09410 [Salinivirgaceae bacterium]|nr:MAG: hypothetical protein C0599_09410 [Salinivirgaceae bacterium]